MKITIHPDGRLVCIADQAEKAGLDLQALGHVSVKRASTVEFNEATQVWEVRWTDQPDRVAFQHPRRATCLAWEVNHLTQIL